MTTTTTSLLDRAGQLLTGRKMTFTRHDSLPLLMLRFTNERGQWATFVEVQESPPRIAIYSGYPRKVEPGARMAVAEFLTRANHGLSIGNFELDLDDGAVRFKTSLELADVALTAALFDRLLTVNLGETTRHLEAIAGIASGALSVADAVAQLAAPPRP